MVSHFRRRAAVRLGITGVALVVFLMLRTHVGQRYLIPSRSMEPTLHGDGARGDIVLVDKLGLVRPKAPAKLQRFDIVVLRDHENPGQDPLVKRVVSLGDEMLRIAEGDIFVRPLTGGPWSRVQKDPRAHADLRHTFYEHRAGRPAKEPVSRYLSAPIRDDGVCELRAAGSSVEAALQALMPAVLVDRSRCLSSLVPIDASFLDAEGARSFAGARLSNDIGVELDIEVLDPCRGIVLALLQHGRTQAVACDRHGRLAWCDAPGSPPSQGPALAARTAVTLGYLDGRVFLEMDGVLVATVSWPLPADSESDSNCVRFAAAGPSDVPVVRVHRVRLFHDVYYHPENRPRTGLKEYRIEPHEVFLLGDNTFDSTDSRQHGPYAAADIVGRPLAVIGPWRRTRWLAR